MATLPPDKKHAVLCDISRAQHFAWREAVRRRCPDIDPAEVVNEMWAVTGEQTAAAYAKRIDVSKPLALQVARSIVWSSECMGEEAVAEEGNGDEAFVRHNACPWRDWHERLGLLAEDRPGCDAWFRTTIDALNETLGVDLRFETQEALPDGDSCCLRRIWAE